MDTIHGLFETQVERFPACTAAMINDQRITYNKLNEKANQLAHHLLSMGVQPDKPVAICMDRSIDLLIAIIGILKAGGAYLPLDPSHPHDRLWFMLNDNDSPIVITHAPLKNNIMPYQGSILCLDHDRKKIQQHPSHNPTVLIKQNQLAYIIYTSGSTGMPKGVLIEHKSVLNYCAWVKDYCHLEPGQRIDFSSNYSFDMAISTSIVPLMLGLTIVMTDDEIKKNLRRYLQYLRRYDINIIKATPSYFKALTHEAQQSVIPLPHLQSIILGGEPLYTADCLAWFEVYPHHVLYNEYGPTETTVGVSVHLVTRDNCSPSDIAIPMGKPGNNINLYILGADKKPVSEGEIGELYIGGHCLARGYLNQTQLTRERFIEEPLHQNVTIRLYKTGDLCRQLPDHTIEYMGRNDQQIKWHGFRIELAEIEYALAKHPAIEDVAVLVKNKASHEKQLVAYYVLKHPENSFESKTLRDYLQGHLPSYMIPTAFVSVSAFPRTTNDKLDITALPEPTSTSLEAYMPPRTKLEQTIASIWSEEIGCEAIGRHDHFFELGGHSLTAARIISRLEKITGKAISIRDFYQSPTVSTLAIVIRRSKKINHETYKKIQKKNHEVLPLTDFQFTIWVSNLFAPNVKRLNLVGRKRFQGPIDVDALTAAFGSLFKKHHVLFYCVCQMSPAQYLRKNLNFNLVENDLRSLSKQDTEAKLIGSVDALMNHYPWSKNKPWIIATLFYLDEDINELQISMPHIIADYASIDILFSDLSSFYNSHQRGLTSLKVYAEKQFKDYVINEHYDTKRQSEKNLAFWTDYLKNVGLFRFPAAYIITNMRSGNFPYSTYMPLSNLGLNQLHHFCATHHVSFTNGLGAILWLALLRCCGHQDIHKPFFMNMIKSTRNNPIYDDKMGCFLRIEPLKIDENTQPTLISLSKQMHQSTMDAMPYQNCPSLAKAACINTMQSKRKTLSRYLLNGCIYAYTKLFRSLKLNYTIFSMYGRLTAFKTNKDKAFVINLNILPNFMENESPKKEATLFGLPEKEIQLYHYDLLSIDYVFEACFLRDEHKTPYVVLSGNIRPFFRERIAREMINILQHETQPTVSDQTEPLST